MFQLSQPALSSQAPDSHGDPILQECSLDVAPRSTNLSRLGHQQHSAGIQAFFAVAAPQRQLHQGETAAGLKTCLIAVLSLAVNGQLTMQAAALPSFIQKRVVSTTSPRCDLDTSHLHWLFLLLLKSFCYA